MHMEVFQGQRECLAERSEHFTCKRDDTNESMISLRMRKKNTKNNVTGFQIYQISQNLVN